MIRAMPILLICFLAAVSGARAQAVPLTLEEALARAEAANPNILAAGARARAGEMGARAEKGRSLGELKLNGGWIRNSEEGLVRPITPEILSSGVPQMPFDDQYAFWSLDYRVPLLGWGTMSGSREMARNIAGAGKSATRRTVREIRHRVLATYLGLLSLEAQAVALSAELAALDSLAAHIELGRQAGQYSRIDLLKVQVDRQGAVMRRQDIEAQRRQRYADLMALMGETWVEDGRYELMPVAEAAADTVLPPVEDLIDNALAARSDLLAARRTAAAKRAAVRVAAGSRWPQVSLGAKLSGVHAGTIDYDDTYWSVDARVSMPLFDMGRRRNLASKADLDARGAELRVSDLEGRIRSEVVAAVAQVERARSAMSSQRIALELAGEVHRLERLRYDAGRGDIDNLLRSRAERMLASAALIRARHDFLIALDNLQLASEGEMR